MNSIISDEENNRRHFVKANRAKVARVTTDLYYAKQTIHISQSRKSVRFIISIVVNPEIYNGQEYHTREKTVVNRDKKRNGERKSES